MNLYQRVWDGGYGKRHARIMACSATQNRKLAALQRVWRRMLAFKWPSPPKNDVMDYIWSIE